MSARQAIGRGLAMVALVISVPWAAQGEEYDAAFWRDMSVAFEQAVRVQRDVLLAREQGAPDALWIGRDCDQAMVIPEPELQAYAEAVSGVFSAIRTHDLNYVDLLDLASELPPVVRVLVMQLNTEVEDARSAMAPDEVVRWIVDGQDRIRARILENIDANVTAAREEYEEAVGVLSDRGAQTSGSKKDGR